MSYWWEINIICHFISKRGLKGAQILKFHIFERYIRILFFLPILMWFLAHPTLGQVSYCYHWASVVHLSLAFHILINSSKTTRPIWTKLWWNGPLMAPFQTCVRLYRLPIKIAAKLNIEKRGDEMSIAALV